MHVLSLSLLCLRASVCMLMQGLWNGTGDELHSLSRSLISHCACWRARLSFCRSFFACVLFHSFSPFFFFFFCKRTKKLVSHSERENEPRGWRRQVTGDRERERERRRWVTVTSGTEYRHDCLFRDESEKGRQKERRTYQWVRVSERVLSSSS